jgi:hypothetical protein
MPALTLRGGDVDRAKFIRIGSHHVEVREAAALNLSS